MRRFPALAILASIALGSAVTLAIASPAAAHGIGAPDKHLASTPTPSSPASTESHGCQKLYIQLNGSDPATVTCLDLPAGSTGVHPNTGEVSCGNSLNLFVDAYQSGDEICFGGTGFANLTDYQHCHWVWFPAGPRWQCFGWNDDATSWASHSQTGKFYSDINGNGICASFGANGNGNFTWNPIPNDSLSSICIGSCPPSPTYSC